MNIGAVYERQGRYEEALVQYQQALAVFLAVHGQEHPSVAASHVNIGNVYHRQGKYEEALVELKKGLDVLVTVHGHEHLDVAASYNNMGGVYNSQGHYEQSVAMSYGNMGYVYRSLGEMFTKTYSIFLKVLGPDHPHTQQAKSDVDRREKGVKAKSR